MLPKVLIGPAKPHWLNAEEAKQFVLRGAEQYPHLDSNFLLEICFQHPRRFDDYFPNFDPQRHRAFQQVRTMGWVYDNLKYDRNKELNFWYTQFDQFEETDMGSYLKFEMLKMKSWPVPPVIVEAEFAVELGAFPSIVGRPYYLIEGTRRVSYARRMMELGLLDSQTNVTLVEIQGL